jgi:hypothetical protein
LLKKYLEDIFADVISINIIYNIAFGMLLPFNI